MRAPYQSRPAERGTVTAASRREAIPARVQNALAGIALTALSFFVFAGGNAIGKWVESDIPVGETLCVRSAVTLLLLVPFLRRRDFRIAQAVGHPWLHVLRMAGTVIDSSSYYFAMAALPLADVSAIYLASPIYVTGMSALFLGERVGWRRWTAVVVGFAGVLIALRPSGAGLSAHALVAVVGSLFFSMSLVATRRLRGAPNIVLVTSQTVALLVATLATAAAWVWPTPAQAGLLALLGVVTMAGFLLMYHGLQLAFASVVAPFQYSSIIWAVVLGYLVFGDVPGSATLTGSAVIIGAGVFIVWRERRVAPQ
jgi:drug/metabolite transporter (DMT)-like permease